MSANSSRLAFLSLAFAGLSCAARAPSAPPAPVSARLTHGAAVGEVEATSAVAWGRCGQASTFSVQIEGAAAPLSAAVAAEHDFTGVIRFESLHPDTAYRYRAWCGTAADAAVEGEFRTPPTAETAAPVRFAWSGDVGGQNVCRDAERGYFIFDTMRQRRPAFFVALGDMIYADDACKETGLFHNRQIAGPGPSEATKASFWEHWRYNRADAASLRFFLSTPYYPVWDDHEISNDAGPLHDTLPSAPDQHRLAPARAAFADYQPLANRDEFYRRARWGKNVELFILDTREYRELNSAPDVGKTPKTLLGARQRQWLIDALSHSDATWKVVVSSVPISIPTAGDGWANFRGKKGFERELRLILAAARQARVENMVWITTDVHFATGFRYTPAPGFHFLEFTSGPLNAGMFPKQDLDESLHPERLFFYGGPLPRQVQSFEQASEFFNFGEMEVDAAGLLTVRIVNSGGDVVFEEKYTPQ